MSNGSIRLEININENAESLMEAYFNNKINVEQEKKLCGDGIEKSVPRNLHLSSLGKPPDAKR